VKNLKNHKIRTFEVLRFLYKTLQQPCLIHWSENTLKTHAIAELSGSTARTLLKPKVILYWRIETQTSVT